MPIRALSNHEGRRPVCVLCQCLIFFQDFLEHPVFRLKADILCDSAFTCHYCNLSNVWLWIVKGGVLC